MHWDIQLHFCSLFTQDFFTAGEFVRMNTIDKGLKNLRSVIGFYRDTTGKHKIGLLCHCTLSSLSLSLLSPCLLIFPNLSLSNLHPSSEMLITNFMKEETSHGLPSSDSSCGEVMLEVDAYVHPTKLDGTIRGIYIVSSPAFDSEVH